MVALAAVALAWGTSYAIIKDTLNVIRPFTLMLFRFGLSALFLGIIYAGKLKKITTRDLRRGGLIGLFMFGAFFCLVTGIQFTTASKQSVLIGSYVVIVPFLSVLFNGTRPGAYAFAGAGLAVVGLGLLTLGDGIDGFNRGDAVSALCAVFFALHMIAIERFGKDSDPILMTIIQLAVTAALFLVLALAFESVDFGVIARAALPIGYLVAVTTVLAFAVQNVAQRHITSTSTALILTLESAFGSVFAVFYLRERMTPLMALGCLVVLAGIVTQESAGLVDF